MFGSRRGIPQTTACMLREASRLGVLDHNEKSLLVNSHWEQSAVQTAGSCWGGGTVKVVGVLSVHGQRMAEGEVQVNIKGL